ncbi:unnamed protein product [Cuscuta epithymum]|uniref:Uncharacterized protein n=1 Tax=Cuscuta epithymum TaxID=186058 RepID=A0AAV0F6V1_9ASTE|nr:unnamed protein product [Cuscuta epithymum]
MEASLHAKSEMKSGLLKQIEEKKLELDGLELEVSNVNFALMDEKEHGMQAELERKNRQIEERKFPSSIQLKKSDKFKLDKKIEELKRERDRMVFYSDDRAILSLKKAELETKKKIHKIVDECQDRIKELMKGKLPPDKDLKKEVRQVQSTLHKEIEDFSVKARDAEKNLNMVQAKIDGVNDNLYKLNKEAESTDEGIIHW